MTRPARPDRELCECCGFRDRVRHVRVRPLGTASGGERRLALCERCLEAPHRTWRLRWVLAPASEDRAA